MSPISEWKFKYFRPEEFKCRCGCGLMNINLELVALLDRTRDALGRPIVIKSGSRCPTHNADEGGEPNSAHPDGDAADVKCLASDTRWMLLRIFFSLGIKRIGIGMNFLHIDISKKLPQLVTWMY